METLSFGEPQTIVALIFVAIALVLAGTFALIARRARRDVPLEDVSKVAYAARPYWLAFLGFLLGGIVLATLFFLPYSAAEKPTASVVVSGGQFYWSVSPPEVPAGTAVRFEVTSVDVNHGFGVYSPEGELLGNVQAMPGYTNDLELTLDQPGSYLLSCLEFCGVGHHKMTRELIVTPR